MAAKIVGKDGDICGCFLIGIPQKHQSGSDITGCDLILVIILQVIGIIIRQLPDNSFRSI